MKRMSIFLLMNLFIIFLNNMSLASLNSRIANIHKEIQAINKLHFKKVMLILNLIDYIDCTPIINIYYDPSDRIRKVIIYGVVVGGVQKTIQKDIFYFNSKEQLIYHVHYYGDVINEKPEYLELGAAGHAYFHRKKRIAMDGSVHPMLYTNKEIDKMLYYRTAKQVIKDQEEGAMYNVDVIDEKKVYKDEFTFRSPKKGDQTTTHFHDVVLRTGPSTKSRKILLLPALQTVKVIAVGKKERIGYLGSHRWYKIEYQADRKNKKVGWVFGALLSPVEKKIR